MMICRWIATGVLVSILLFSLSTTTVADPVQPTDDSSTPSLPTWILVHGTYGGAWVWYKIQVLLESEGYPVYAMDLTSHGNLDDSRTADSVRTIEDWASPLLDCLSNLTGKAILVTHSMGGAAISLAMEMYPDKIAKAVFIAAVMPSNGKVVGRYILDKLEQQVDAGVIKLNYENGPLQFATSLEINVTAAETVLFGNCPRENLNLLRDILSRFPYRPFIKSLTLTDERYGSVPRYYIKVGLDNTIGAAQQTICDENPPKVQFTLKNGDYAPMFSEAPYLYFMLKSVLKY